MPNPKKAPFRRDDLALVKPTIRKWGTRKHSAKATETVVNTHATSTSAVAARKALVAKEAISGITKIEARARKYHMSVTLPGVDEGMRIIPKSLLPEWLKKMEGFREDYEKAAKEFIENYSVYVAEAADSLGTLFNPGDYPSVGDIENKFGFSIVVAPMPVGQDFRMALPDAEREAIAKQIDQQTAEVVSRTTLTLWDKIYELTDGLSEALRKYTGQKKGAFKSAVVDNIKSYCDILDDLNITDNRELKQMKNRLLRELCKHDADDLRADDALRLDVAESALTIANKAKGKLKAA